jgi:hypothetical protein
MQTTKLNDDIFQWIANIIQTCTNDFHFDSVDRLIDLYHQREKDEDKQVELKLLRKAKWDEIHNVLL